MNFKEHFIKIFYLSVIYFFSSKLTHIYFLALFPLFNSVPKNYKDNTGSYIPKTHPKEMSRSCYHLFFIFQLLVRSVFPSILVFTPSYQKLFQHKRIFKKNLADHSRPDMNNIPCCDLRAVSTEQPVFLHRREHNEVTSAHGWYCLPILFLNVLNTARLRKLNIS